MEGDNSPRKGPHPSRDMTRTISLLQAGWSEACSSGLPQSPGSCCRPAGQGARTGFVSFLLTVLLPHLLSGPAPGQQLLTLPGPVTLPVTVQSLRSLSTCDLGQTAEEQTRVYGKFKKFLGGWRRKRVATMKDSRIQQWQH